MQPTEPHAVSNKALLPIIRACINVGDDRIPIQIICIRKADAVLFDILGILCAIEFQTNLLFVPTKIPRVNNYCTDKNRPAVKEKLGVGARARARQARELLIFIAKPSIQPIFTQLSHFVNGFWGRVGVKSH